jgi:tetratricopeptide (TPR) repeat protein
MKTILFLLLFSTSSVIIAQTAESYHNKAQEESDAGNYKAALKEIEKALEMESVNADFMNSKAYYLYKLKQYQEAYNAYSKAILVANKAESYSGRAIILEAYGEYNSAIEDYTQAIRYAKIDTIKYMQYSNRAAAKMRKRDFKGAYDDLMVAYKFDTTSLGVLTNLGAVCDEVGKGDETIKYLLKAIEVDSNFYPAYANIGYKYQEMGKYEKAIEYYNIVLEFNPEEPLGYSNRSYNRYKLGNLKDAMKDINKSIKLYPGNSYAYRIRALIYIEQGKFDKVCEDLEFAIKQGFTTSYGNEVIDLQKKHCNK